MTTDHAWGEGATKFMRCALELRAAGAAPVRGGRGDGRGPRCSGCRPDDRLSVVPRGLGPKKFSRFLVTSNLVAHV